VFESFFTQLDLPHLMRQTDHHGLGDLVSAEARAPEIGHALDPVVRMAPSARSLGADQEP
jgi:hypothetical protein